MQNFDPSKIMTTTNLTPSLTITPVTPVMTPMTLMTPVTSVNSENPCSHDLKLKPGQCKYCKKRFKVTNNLIAHMNESHKDIPSGTCLPCNKKPYVKKPKMNTEIRKCDQCGKTFSQWNNFDTHSKSHTGEKKFKCDIQNCDYASSQSTKLARHKAAVHKIGINYICDICNKGFYDSNDYKKHLDCHAKKNFLKESCKTCPKVFDTKKALKAHMESVHPDSILGLIPSDFAHFQNNQILGIQIIKQQNTSGTSNTVPLNPSNSPSTMDLVQIPSNGPQIFNPFQMIHGFQQTVPPSSMFYQPVLPYHPWPWRYQEHESVETQPLQNLYNVQNRSFVSNAQEVPYPPQNIQPDKNVFDESKHSKVSNEPTNDIMENVDWFPEVDLLQMALNGIE